MSAISMARRANVKQIQKRPRSGTWFDVIDPVAVVRGGSAGFSVMVLGLLATPAVAGLAPGLVPAWQIATGVMGFVVAGARPGAARSASLNGAAAALNGYLFVVPVLLMTNMRPTLTVIVCGVIAAVAVGAFAGASRLWLRAARARLGATADGKGKNR